MTDAKIALRELLEKGSDATFLREMIGFAAQRLMELETEALCGAGHGERSPERVNRKRRTAALLALSGWMCSDSPGWGFERSLWT